jgi:hypothetical protein
MRQDESLASLQVPYRTKGKEQPYFHADTIEEFNLSKDDQVHGTNYKFNFVKQNALLAANVAEQNIRSI